MVAIRYALLGIGFVLVLSIVGCGGDSSDDAAETGVKVETVAQTPEGQGETVVQTPAGQGETSTAQGTGVEHSVDFSRTWFTPPMMTIRTGDSVVFHNVDTESHPVTRRILNTFKRHFIP